MEIVLNNKAYLFLLIKIVWSLGTKKKSKQATQTTEQLHLGTVLTISGTKSIPTFPAVTNTYRFLAFQAGTILATQAKPSVLRTVSLLCVGFPYSPG